MTKRGFFIVLSFILFSSLAFAVDSTLDTDHDGIPDDYELENGLDNLESNVDKDTDFDGLLDIEEFMLGTDPSKDDTDGDGYYDKQEFDSGSDPTSKFSPLYSNILKIVVTVLISLAIIAIIIYLFTLIKPKSENRKPSKEKKEKTKKKKEGSNVLSSMVEFFLGPSIKKAKEKDRLKEKEQIKDVKDVYLDSNQVLKKLNLEIDLEKKFKDRKENDNKITFSPSDNSFESQLKRVLKNNIRKNKVGDILSYFDKEMDNEELTLLEEKKSKKEIMDWYRQRKEMKQKIIDLAKEEKKEAVDEPKKEKQDSKPPEEPSIFDMIYTGKESDSNSKDVFDRLESINRK